MLFIRKHLTAVLLDSAVLVMVTGSVVLFVVALGL